MDCFQHAPRGNIDICALSHTHETCMESLEQSCVTKENQKEGSASKPTNGPLGAGGINRGGGTAEIPWHSTGIPHTTSQFELSSLQNHFQYTKAKRSASAPQNRASLALSSPSSADLNSHSRISRSGMSRTLLILHKTSSQITAHSYESSPPTAAEDPIENPTSARGPALKIFYQAAEISDSSHSSNSLKDTQSLGAWHATEHLPCVSCMGVIHRSWDSSRMGFSDPLRVGKLYGSLPRGTEGCMCPWQHFQLCLPTPINPHTAADPPQPLQTLQCPGRKRAAPKSPKHWKNIFWAKLRQQSENLALCKLQRYFTSSPKY